MLTGVRDLDFKILLQLDDKSLVNYCITDKKSNEFCQDERFWEQLVISRFSYIDPYILNKYRNHRSWSNYYIRDLRKVNTAIGRDLEIYLIEGVVNGRFDHVVIAIHNGVDIHADDGYPIVGAIERDNFELVKYLVENGASVTGAPGDIEGQGWPLRVALTQKDFEIVKYLIEKGAARDFDLQTIDIYLHDFPVFIYVPWIESEREEAKNKIIEYLGEKLGYDPVLHRHPHR
jgi:hypothetical protein